MATPREQLASILKKSRLEAGFDSHGSLAKRLNMSRPVISKAENPAQPVPSDVLLAAWSGATGMPLDTLTELARRSKSGTPEWFVPYLTAEREATSLRFWGPLLIPGLLQTEPYVHALLSARRRTPEQLAELVTARLERQQVLGRARVTAVVDHTVLLRRIGSAQVMAEQCGHLARLVEEQVISLHVVPEGTNVGLGGAFAIATRDGMSTVSLTTSTRDITSTAADVADDNMALFDVVLGASLAVVPSLDFVRQQEEQWKAHT